MDSPPQPPQRLLIGLDPGLTITGYGIVRSGHKPQLVEAGVIRISRNQSLPSRLKELYEGISEVFASYTIESVAIEQLFSHYERPRTAILMGHARGVLCLSAANVGLLVHSYEPTRVKKTLTGNGRAPKSQMQMAVQMQLGLREPPDPPDVADALAIALCHHFATGPSAKLFDSGSQR